MIANSKIGVPVRMTARQVRAYFPKNKGSNVVVDDDKNNTIMSKLRLRDLHDQMDLGQPEIARSLAVTETLISRMSQRSKAHGAELVVMVIPSKEFIFHRYLSASHQPLPELYERMATSEASLRSSVFSWLAEQGIAYVDIAPDLLEAVTKQGALYPHDNDGHPLPPGYEVYAKGLHERFLAGHLATARGAADK